MRAIVDRPSPNFDARRPGAPVDILLLHYTGMPTAAGALTRLCDPAAKVSAHYTIDEDGTVYRHVPEERRAWHAGVSYWAGERDINARSIGIELVNPGHEFGYRDFPTPQIAALIALSHGILERHPIPARRVLGHSDVAPRRKIDPGEKFPWARLAEAGIGAWPKHPRIDLSRAVQVPEVQRDLAAIGYECPATGVLDEDTRFAVAAFQRHFRPAIVSGIPDGETLALAALLRRSD
ncbi:MAG: N-acetylmuramoyl-L-alanine amidase [Candidatus Odyssella sp.]|nr:N-acetylmuramoyl-L-alanine amidase [Candidatus Odyssella sp.]